MFGSQGNLRRIIGMDDLNLSWLLQIFISISQMGNKTKDCRKIFSTMNLTFMEFGKMNGTEQQRVLRREK